MALTTRHIQPLLSSGVHEAPSARAVASAPSPTVRITVTAIPAGATASRPVPIPRIAVSPAAARATASMPLPTATVTGGEAIPANLPTRLIFARNTTTMALRYRTTLVLDPDVTTLVHDTSAMVLAVDG